MKERPILFSTEMVRAILEGRKTQTRRVMKPQPSDDFSPIACEWYAPLVIDRDGTEQPGTEIFGVYSDEEGYRCPYGAPGDQLYVREAWNFVGTDMNRLGRTHSTQDAVIYYAADKTRRTIERPFQEVEKLMQPQKRYVSVRPSIHMPRWASRIQLEILSIRTERLQDIGYEDAVAEGIEHSFPQVDIVSFYSLWDSINAKRGFGVNTNPWVWVIEFKVVTK